MPGSQKNAPVVGVTGLLCNGFGLNERVLAGNLAHSQGRASSLSSLHCGDLAACSFGVHMGLATHHDSLVFALARCEA